MASKCQKCVKFFILIVSALIICCGLALLIIALAALNLDYVPSDDFHDWMSTFKLALIILSLILMEIGLMGVFSAWKQNRCVIFIFQIQITFFCLIFLSTGILALAIYQNIVKNISCSNLDVLDDASSVISKSQNLLCSSSCPCNCENQEVISYLSTRGTSLYISTSGVKRAQDCPNFSSIIGSYDNIADALGKVEEKFDCSGLCSKNYIYLFSDINNGIPQNMCFQKIIDEMKKILKLLAAVGLTIGIIKFITIWVACFLCCKARKKKNTGKVQDDDYGNVGVKSSEMNLQTPHQQVQKYY